MRSASQSVRDHGESGFTLLEILIGLLVSVLIMAGLTAAMRTMHLGWDATVSTLGKQDLFANGLHIISGDISRVQRMADKVENAERFLFRGSRSELIFLLAERPASDQEGLHWIRLFARQSDAGVALVRMRAPYETRLQDLEGIQWRDPVVLLEGNFVIGFSYRAPLGGFPSWSASWNIANRLPEQIRVEVLDPESGRFLMPPLVQTLDIRAEADCIDPKSGGCTIDTKGELIPRKADDNG
jgi:hypothetical protein